MIDSKFIHGIQPDGFVEVDAARLLLILDRFSIPKDRKTFPKQCVPNSPFAAHFASEYYLQKLDFLIRYPGYFVFELIELYKTNDPHASDRSQVMALIQQIIQDQEPEFQTIPFRKFWRGAYERRDDVENWWWARGLVFTGFETRGKAAPWKHYFLTKTGQDVATSLVAGVQDAKWYAKRINEIHQYMGHLPASEIKNRQYSHERYRQANLNELIPDLSEDEIFSHYKSVFGEVLEVKSE